MIIGIDIDDTVSDTYEISFAYAQKYTIEELKRDGKINDVKIEHSEYLDILHNWTEDENIAFWTKYLEKIQANANQITLSSQTINKLREEGHKIVFITARWTCDFSDVEAVTIKWLKEKNINYDDIVFGCEDKKQVSIDQNVDIFIDDSFKHCVSVSEAGIKSFLMDSRLNGGFENKDVERVYSWPHIYNKIKEGNS